MRAIEKNNAVNYKLSELSNGVLNLINSLLKNSIRGFRILIVFLSDEYRFFRRFEYTKSNISNHLLEKACRFFGISLKTNRRKDRRSGKRANGFSRIFQQKEKKDKIRRSIFPQIKKSKKSKGNFYRPPG